MPFREEEKQSNPTTKPPILITSFTPRQLLLSKPNMKKQSKKETETNKSPISLTPENRVLLHQSICGYLQLNGFLKTLKNFHREAHIEKDSWKNFPLSLEEMCQKHLKKCHVTNDKKQDAKLTDNGDDNIASVENVERRKENGAIDGEEPKAILEKDAVNGDNGKSKKKKKSKNANDTFNDVNGGTQLKDLEQPSQDLSEPTEPGKKSKDKKKRKHESEHLHKKVTAEETTSDNADNVSQDKKTEDNPIPKDKVDKEKKSSKKRKKCSSDENGIDHVEATPLDDSKSRKIDKSDLSNGIQQATKTPTGLANGVSGEDGGTKSKKQEKTEERNGSAEPKTTVNAFRRVKPDEVEFVDERLQDNSYWAKGGADSGYGAKAQEVLGQVRGRDFRHEKTKKKRGSYRGGQIDLQSHSVKFNYDDDDE